MTSKFHESTQVVSFDLWKTLLRSDPNHKAARAAAIADALGVTLDHDEFMVLIHTQDALADEISETTGEDVGFEQRIGMVARAAGRPAPGEEGLASLYVELSRVFAEHPPVLIDPRTDEVLQELVRQGFRLAISSNTGFHKGPEMREALDRLGILGYFATTVFSNEVGYAKPDPHFFDALVEAAGVPAGAITHIGDNRRADVGGAEAAGMHAILLEESTSLAEALGLEI